MKLINSSGKFAVCVLAGLALNLAACGEKPAHPDDPTAVIDPENWTGFGRTSGEQHYSPLDQIDADSVDDLSLAWHFDLEPGYSASSPIAADGKLFITTGHSHIRAFDAPTGKLLWEYDGGTRERAKNRLQISWGNKGIAWHDGKILLGTTDGLVTALDANTGQQIWQTRDFPENDIRNMNGAPRVFGDKVVVGHGGADVSPLRGFVTAYDVNTGERAWRFYTVPGDPSKEPENRAMEIAAPTWKGDWHGKGGGGTAWNAFSYDPDLNMVYIGVGNGYPYMQKKRSPGGGDNLFLASIVAVDADTGEYRWHYQVCPAEQWDCTATQDMTLATMEIDGKQRKVLMQAPKNGFFYVLDRETGEFISAEKLAKVTWAEGIDENGRPMQVDAVARYENQKGMVEMWPGPTGAHNWLPQAYSPKTGLVYIPVIEQGALIGDGDAGGGDLGLGIGASLLPEAELDDPLNRTSYLKAWNPLTQQAEWQIDLPGSWPGGVLATGGGLVFQGRVDRHLVAYDASTGEEVWSWKTTAPIVAPPISYSVDGKQYITVITGMGGNGAGVMSLGNAAYRTDYGIQRQVLTFALGGTDDYQPVDPPERLLPRDPDFASDPARIQNGAILYGITGCIACHGYNAVGGGAAPDLRYSPTIVDSDTFNAILDGALKPNGMPDFPDLTRAQREDIRLYLRARSKQVPAEEARLKAAAVAKASLGGAPPEAYAGTWDIVVSTPIGDQPAVLVLEVDGTALSGRVESDQGDMNVSGRVAKGRAQFAGKATQPMEMTVSYDLLASGDTLSGETKSGPFGTFDMTGSKRK